MMMKNKQVIVCLAGLLIINICDVTSLPLNTPKEKVERDVQSEPISSVSPGDSDQFRESVDSLILRKNILERMLKETNERLAIKQKDEIVVDVRTLGPAPLGRRPPRPAKKTTRGYEERELDSSPGDINTLKQLLQRLEAREHTEQDTTKAPVSSVDVLHEKLQKLDADVYKLLNKQGSPSKRNREGPYPKELIPDEN